MDDIVDECGRRHLSGPQNLRYMEKEIIARTYSFSYENHFRPMLIRLIGLIRVETLEAMCDSNKLALLKSSLDTLTEERNRQAHTYTTNSQIATQNALAPSVLIIQHLPAVCDGLQDIERCLRRLAT